MKQIIIACAGGFGWEISEYLRQDIERGLLEGYALKGVIDDNEESSNRAPLAVPFLGTISAYRPEIDEHLLIAVGKPSARRNIKKRLDNVGSCYMSYIHSSCYIAVTAKIGRGVIVCPNSVVNCGVDLGDFSLLNVFCSIGHGAQVGDFSVLSPYVAVNGNARVGEDCFLGTRATVFPRVVLGNKCVVDSHSFVKENVDDKKMISVRGNYLVVDNRLG